MPKKGGKKRPSVTMKQRAFIAAYVSSYGIKSQACRESGIAYRTVMEWFKLPHFVEALERADEEWWETLKASVMHRAIKKSDNLAMFLLKSKWPEIFQDEVRAAKIIKEKKLAQRPTSITLNFTASALPARLQNSPQFLNGPDLDDDERVTVVEAEDE